jgi:hypothetical protein
MSYLICIALLVIALKALTHARPGAPATPSLVSRSAVQTAQYANAAAAAHATRLTDWRVDFSRPPEPKRDPKSVARAALMLYYPSSGE